MRHLLITDRFLPHIGGSRLYYFNVFSRFPAADERIVLTTQEPYSDEFDGTTDLEIIRVHRRRAAKLKFARMQDAPFYMELLDATDRIVKTRGVDVIHCGEPLPGAAVAFWLRRRRGVPFVTYAHDEPLGPRTRLQPAVRARLFRASNGVIACCTYAYKRVIEERISPARLILAQPGVDSTCFSPGEPDESLKVELKKATGPVLLSVGRLEKYKGHDQLMRAVAILKEKGLEFTWVIVGDGPQRNALVEGARECGLADSVIFEGKVSRERLVGLYRAADVFALAPRPHEGIVREGFCIAYLEAAACGVPVVGSAVGGTDDSVKDGVTGFLVDPGDENALAERIERLLADEALRARMARAAREHALRFTWERTARKIRRFAEEIVSG